MLATIAADQDAIIRAHARGPLVVDGGPGTGKTVVALHRAAFLMYADARVAQGSGGVLFVGPGRQYLDYADDVLPSLGEDRVAMCTLRDLVVEGASAVEEPNPGVARLKARLDQEPIVDAAVRFYEEPPVEERERVAADLIASDSTEMQVMQADACCAASRPTFQVCSTAGWPRTPRASPASSGPTASRRGSA